MLLTIAVLVISFSVLIETTILNNRFYISAIGKADIPLYFYNNWDSILETNPDLTSDEKLQVSMLKAFSREFSMEWLKRIITTTAGDILKFIKGDTKTITTIFDLKRKKENYTKFLILELEAVPLEELRAWGIEKGRLQLRAEQMADDMVKLPDSLNIQELVGNEVLESLNTTLEPIRKIRQLYITVPVILIIMLLAALYMLLGLRKTMKYVGRSIFILGILFLGVGFFIKTKAAIYIYEIFTEDLSFLNGIAASLLQGFITSHIVLSCTLMMLGVVLNLEKILFKFNTAKENRKISFFGD